MTTTFEQTTVQQNAQRQLMTNIKDYLESTQNDNGFFPTPEIVLMSNEIGFAVSTLLEDGITKTKHLQVTVNDINSNYLRKEVESAFTPNNLLTIVHNFVKQYDNLIVSESFVQVDEYQDKKSYGFTVKSDDRTLLVLVLNHKQIGQPQA